MPYLENISVLSLGNRDVNTLMALILFGILIKNNLLLEEKKVKVYLKKKYISDRILSC